jgi:pectate lyase
MEALMNFSLLGSSVTTVLLAVFQVNSAPDFSLVGFAAGVTGGTGGRTVQVKTASDFKSNCQSSEKLIIQVSGKIDNASVSIASNKTIIGVGSTGEITGTTLSMTDGSNIIVRNIKIHSGPKGADIFTIQGGKNIWIDHCEIYNAIGDLNGDGKIDTVGDIVGGDVDWYDGLIDATESSANITISWNKIHDSFKAMLVGKSDSDLEDRKITYHHNYFYNLWERIPSYRGGTGHVYNNYYSAIQHSCVNSRMGAKLRVEGNIFENSGSGAIDSKTKLTWGPIGAYYSATVGCWDVKDNVFTGCKGNQPTASTCSFTPPYDYAKTLNASSDVKTIVTAWAGVGKLDASGIIPANDGVRYAGSAMSNNTHEGIYNCRGEKMSFKNGYRPGIFIVKKQTGIHVSMNGLK